jgi:hypothetical protein
MLAIAAEMVLSDKKQTTFQDPYDSAEEVIVVIPVDRCRGLHACNCRKLKPARRRRRMTRHPTMNHAYS